MSVDPIWFGPAGRPLFAMLHVPEGGRARGAIICCPSVGTEATSSYESLRLLAGQLESAGFAVLRVDYPGTGNSAGEADDDEEIDTWRTSLPAAMGLLRRMGVTRLGVVGLRLGSLLAALESVGEPSIGAVALWDPCPSGQAFIREQRALAALSRESTGLVGGSSSGVEPGSVELLGWVVGPKRRAELESLTLDHIEPPARRCLVLLRSDRPMPLSLGLWRGSPRVEWEPAVGQDALIDVMPNESRVPTKTLSTISAWFDRVMPRDPQRLRGYNRSEALLPVSGWPVVREKAMRLGSLGLFTVVTEAIGRRPEATVVFLNAGVIPHTGPSRLWVTLARQLASRGLRTVRLDLSGLGESPARPGQVRHLAHPLEAMDDIGLALESLDLDPEEVIMAGLCSGAYHAIEAGLRLPVRGVCAINPILSFDPPEVKAGSRLDGQRQAVVPFNELIKRLRRRPGLAEWGEHRAPSALWWLLDKTGFQAHPAHSLEELAHRGVPAALLCGEVEARPFLHRARWSFDALIRSGAISFDLLSDSDHNLFGAAARTRAQGLILERLTSLARRPCSCPTAVEGDGPLAQARTLPV